MEDIALLCSDSAEHLEDGELLAALGALSGCEKRIREAAVIIRAVLDWQGKLSQSSTENEGPMQEPHGTEEQPNAPEGPSGANPTPKGE